MWSTRNKKSKYLCLGIFLIIIGGILTTIIIGYFFIVIGVILLLAGISSKSEGIGKSSSTTDSIMKEKEYCPKCGARRYSRFSTKCVTCGYIFISDFRKVPTISNKEAEEPKKTSEVQFFPPISKLLQGEKTSKPIPSVSELKTEEMKTIPSSLKEKVEKSFTTCPHCRQKLHLRAKFCFNCGQKVEVLKPIPLISDIEEETPKITLAEEIQPIPPVYVKKEEKRKKEPRVCKFCGMRLPKNKVFCLQCGMIIKIK